MYYSLIWGKLTSLIQQIQLLFKKEWSHKTVSIIYLQAYKMLWVEAVEPQLIGVWLVHSAAHAL
jgi:hypothetical protein